MKTNVITIRADRLNFPLQTCFVGLLSSAVFTVRGDVPDDIESIVVEIERAPDGGTARPNLAASGSRKADGSFSVYLSPYYFSELAMGLSYHVIGLDTKSNRRWLGTGALVILDCPADGSSETPDIIPPDTYIRNPATGLYHKLTAIADADGNVTINLADEGVER